MSDTEHLLSREKSHPEAADGGQVSVRSAGGDPVSSNHTWGGGGREQLSKTKMGFSFELSTEVVSVLHLQSILVLNASNNFLCFTINPAERGVFKLAYFPNI